MKNYIMGTSVKHVADIMKEAIVIEFNKSVMKEQIAIEEPRNNGFYEIYLLGSDNMFEMVRTYAHGISFGILFERGYLGMSEFQRKNEYL